MTLVQIDLRRGRDPRPTPATPAAGVIVAPAAAAPTHTLARPAARILGVGLILLVPLAGPALHSGPTLALLLLGLALLGLNAALLRPDSSEVDPP